MSVNTTTAPMERKLTEAERADEHARMERARTGRQRPRTLHAIIEQGPRLIECPYCDARPGQACRRPGGYHLARFIRCYIRGLITCGELPAVIAGLDMFTGATIIRDGAR